MKKAIAIIILSVAGMALLILIGYLWFLYPWVLDVVFTIIVSFYVTLWSLKIVFKDNNLNK